MKLVFNLPVITGAIGVMMICCFSAAAQNGAKAKNTTAGKTKKTAYKITVDIAGMPQQEVVLEMLRANDNVSADDSIQSDATGHLVLSVNAPEPVLCRLHFSGNRFILLSISKGDVSIKANWDAFDEYTVTGSKPSEELRQLIVSLRAFLREFNQASAAADSLKRMGNIAALEAAHKQITDMNAVFTKYVEHYADTVANEPNAVFASRLVNPQSEGLFIEGFYKGLKRKYPKTIMTKDYDAYYNKMMASIPKPHPPIEAGSMAPNLELQAPDGKTVSLSSLRGKYVLVDFWASWCGPCRGENPNVVAAYNKFKDKNFTIYGVSLDNNKAAWEKAINADGLAWTQVSDLKGWQSGAAALYSVQSIPANFLVDPKGKVIAHHLRGEDLQKTLEKTLK